MATRTRKKEEMAEDAEPTRAELRREHLLATARSLFVDQGFHQTGMAQIATASGIKVGQIYRDFSNKEDIIAAICERDVTAWLEEDRLREAVEAKDLAAVRDWMDRFVFSDDSVEECRLMSEIVAEAGRNQRIADLNQCIDLRIRESLSAALAAVTSDRECSEEQDALMNFILALGIGITMQRALDPGRKYDPMFRYVSKIIDERIGALAE